MADDDQTLSANGSLARLAEALMRAEFLGARKEAKSKGGSEPHGSGVPQGLHGLNLPPAGDVPDDNR